MSISFDDTNELIDKINKISMRKIKEIYEHSVDVDLLTPESSIALDLGSRSFGFAKGILEYCQSVLCVDPDSDIEESDDKRIVMMQKAAVTDKRVAYVTLVKFGNGTGNYIDDGRPMPKGATQERVMAYTMEDLLAISKFDVIKFDIEGSEIPVLLSLTAPPAKQLTVEFHMHTGTTFEKVQEVVKHLNSLGYETVQHEITKRHGLPPNFWDSLFILK